MKEINFDFVGAAFCRPQIGVTDRNNRLIQARAARCRPYEERSDEAMAGLRCKIAFDKSIKTRI